MTGDTGPTKAAGPADAADAVAVAVAVAVAAARAAFPAWRDLNPAERAATLRRFADLIEARKDQQPQDLDAGGRHSGGAPGRPLHRYPHPTPGASIQTPVPTRR
ncbi:aldehyde dehydrogenase family protein [Actinomadura luteofluorescens]|uniref:aldehyde dehydrogenase family protein n=1 Tax=Actinomadura luteofluorescens TaxID=46163 RepID=UPI0015CAC02D